MTPIPSSILSAEWSGPRLAGLGRCLRNRQGSTRRQRSHVMCRLDASAAKASPRRHLRQLPLSRCHRRLQRFQAALPHQHPQHQHPHRHPQHEHPHRHPPPPHPQRHPPPPRPPPPPPPRPPPPPPPPPPPHPHPPHPHPPHQRRHPPHPRPPHQRR